MLSPFGADRHVLTHLARAELALAVFALVYDLGE